MDVTINEGTSFIISNEVGDIIPGKEAGLYGQDTRFLSRYELFLNGIKPTVLTGRQVEYYSSIHYLTNPQMDGIQPDSLSVERKRIIGDILHEDLRIVNHSANPVDIELGFEFDADFADIFEVKAGRTAAAVTPEFLQDTKDNGLIFRYRSGSFYREARVIFSETPHFDGKTVIFNVKLEPAGTWHVCIDFPMLTSQDAVIPTYQCKPFNLTSARPACEASWIQRAPKLFTDYDTLEHAYVQSLTDMAALRLREPSLAKVGIVPAAGIPWFDTCFGRDSLIAAYQTLPYLPEMSYGVLKNLAGYQGTKVSPASEEEPGKLLHEIRWGRITVSGERIPHQIYYGTVDATLLFIILMAEVYKWTADKAFIQGLKENLLRALEWIHAYGDKDRDGYVEYERVGEEGLENQGWKDSGDCVRFADGRFAESPIAVCEVQGYVYKAKLGAADLLDALGDAGKAKSLRKDADILKKNFNRDFWIESMGFFAEALDGDKNQVDSVTSNPGQLLWSGIVEHDKADKLEQRLMAPDMFSGWGIRTMSSEMAAYNPVSYHNGTVWPHDNSIITAGLMDYGYHEAGLRVIDSVLDAGGYFAYQRLPELFCGYERMATAVPVDYPTASSPQAWASGSSMLMLTTLLGMKAQADQKLLTLKPRFPADIYRIYLAGMRIGDSYVSFEVLKERGKFEVNITENPGSFKIRLERWQDEDESGYRNTGTEG
ncbi:MAG: amylo-alpha-1,6-glucosidase [Candidatus Aquicultor sp.]